MEESNEEMRKTNNGEAWRRRRYEAVAM